MSKKVTIGSRPTLRPVEQGGADAWVQDRGGPNATEPLKRLTIDIPESLHRAIKAKCAMRGAKIADEVRELLLQKYSDG